MKTHVQKWGNSIGIRIPMHIATKLHLQPGSLVTLELEEGCLIVKNPQYNLDSMLEAITTDNKHHLMLDDRQTGSEEW